MAEVEYMSNNAYREPERVQKAWSNELCNVAEKIGDLFGGAGAGGVLAKHFDVEVMRGDRSFNLVPEPKDIDGGVLLKCNLDAYDTWIDTLSEVPTLERQQIQQLYLGVGASWGELTYTAKAAKKDRETGKSGSVASKAVKRAENVYKKFMSREELFVQAEQLEKQGDIGGVVNTVEKLTQRQLTDVNRIRYGLGVSMFVLDTTVEVKKDIPIAFRSSLRAELWQHESTLLEFMEAFARSDRHLDVGGDYEKLKNYSFPEFLFAGSIPMDITDAL